MSARAGSKCFGFSFSACAVVVIVIRALSPADNLFGLSFTCKQSFKVFVKRLLKWHCRRMLPGAAEQAVFTQGQRISLPGVVLLKCSYSVATLFAFLMKWTVCLKYVVEGIYTETKVNFRAVHISRTYLVCEMKENNLAAAYLWEGQLGTV